MGNQPWSQFQNGFRERSIINLKGKLQKPSDVRLAIFGLLSCRLKYHVVLSCGGIGQFNCDNRSQQHAEAIYGSFDFIGTTEKHPTKNGVIGFPEFHFETEAKVDFTSVYI